MRMTKKENILEAKSFQFAVRTVKLCKHLREEKNEWTLSKQLLRSGTSIGANIVEAQQAQSRPDFVSRLCISLKESAKTSYWLRLFMATDHLSEKEYASIARDCKELEKLLTSIIKSTKTSGQMTSAVHNEPEKPE